MGNAALLVLTTVHRADDTRIREKLIPVLASLGAVTYASRGPAPSDPAGLDWQELRGGRLARNLRAAALVLRGHFDLVVLHDPELLPLAIVASRLRRAVVVFDVHEDVPAQLCTKAWIWRPLRRPVARLAGLLLRLAERTCDITLAEANYAHLFRRDHPVFPNYPSGLPDPVASTGSVVYVGDVTEERGVVDAAAALAAVDEARRFDVIGRCSADMANRLIATGASVTIHGELPHRAAMTMLASAEVAVAPLRDLPNYRHSLPTKVIEYLGMGVGVVASDLPGTRAAVAGMPGVRLVPAVDRQAWALALGEALRGGLRAEAAANASVVRTRFRWPDAEVRDHYAALLAGPSGRRSR